MATENLRQALAPPLFGQIREFRDLFVLNIRYHAPLFGLAALTAIIAGAASKATGQEAVVDFFGFAEMFLIYMLPLSFSVVIVMRFVAMATRVRPEKPLSWFVGDLKAIFLAPQRLAAALPLILAMTVFINAFTVIKANIPFLQPFAYDALFAELDRIVHLGTDPWRLLHPVFAWEPVTFAINFGYNLWLFVMWAVWCVAGFGRPAEPGHMRFLVAFMLTWLIGGSIAAVFLSSAGPAFFDRLGLSPDPYADLMVYLQGVHQSYPIFALNVQDTLWAAYNGEQNTVVGISAMPSMHNASALLFVLWSRKSAPILFWPLTLFAALIYIGSVHLAWHYAIDAYVGWAIAWLGWWMAGRYSSGSERQRLRLQLAAMSPARQDPDPTRRLPAGNDLPI
jgi:hypothetical protein